MKIKVRNINENVVLYKDTSSGLAWIEDNELGMYRSCHPNIDASGSVKGMKRLGYWGKDDKTVRTNGFIYNISRFSPDDKYNDVLAIACECECCMIRRSENG